MLCQPLYDLDLLLGRQALYGDLYDAAHACLVYGDEALVVHEGEEAHDELAVHAVRDAPVAGNGFAEVLDLEGAFQPGSEETAEGCDERSKGGEDEGVELHWRYVVGIFFCPDWDGVGMRDEDWVWGTVQASEDVGTEVLGIISDCID